VRRPNGREFDVVEDNQKILKVPTIICTTSLEGREINALAVKANGISKSKLKEQRQVMLVGAERSPPIIAKLWGTMFKVRISHVVRISDLHNTLLKKYIKSKHATVARTNN
jgi:hypothetical protein